MKFTPALKFLITGIFIFSTVALGLYLSIKPGEEKNPPGFILEGYKEGAEKTIRQPAVAGQFYPAVPQELENQIEQFLEKTNPVKTEGEISALILPHAGYQFSGGTAAHGFEKLIGEEIDTVILIGSSHYERFEGISVFPEGFFKTPLGDAEIDSELAEKIIKEDERISFVETAHIKEHSLEVELPFLQKVLRNFKIVPIIFGSVSESDYQILARAILKNIKDKNVLLIASSDFSHYPAYEDAEYADGKVIEAILTGQVGNLSETVESLENQKIPGAVTFACGIDAIKTVMEVEKQLGANEIKLLNYANSGDVSGDQSRVVGYAAIGFFGERRGILLNKSERKKLLEIARISVESFIEDGQIPEFQIGESMLNQKLGAFVTLKKDGRLRGCIGRFSPTDIPLYQVVSRMAVASATEDRRFYPVAKDELDELHYEISVLSNLEKIDDWRKIEIGKHGVQIVSGSKSGVFLPQVAVENNWNLEKFLEELCFQKVGLSPDCWKREDIELYVFTAQVFGEE